MTDHLRDVPEPIAERARVIIQLAENTDAIHVADILAPWVREDPETFVQVMIAIALMADKDRRVKHAHAAYGRGVRTPAVINLERLYQRNRVRKNRDVKRHQGEDGAA
ncbi:hypothetical protein [Amycolatopsis sp. CFH S0078]|uniref:hypothetical protein n=1 Tax=Amycolatopsis sp. CFH S0078 TaxID=1644108 RepID=UPI00106EACB0|nr:hypothetical protein [Amycolatopsis sp. CFH S0078]